MPAQPSAAVAAALDAAARSFGVPRDVLYGIAATESNFDPSVIGDQGQSFGLLQVQLATAQAVGFGTTPQDLLDPGTNAAAGAAYLAAQLQRFQGNLVAAVSAYNAGAGGVMSNSGYIQQVATTATEFAQQWGMAPSFDASVLAPADSSQAVLLGVVLVALAGLLAWSLGG